MCIRDSIKAVTYLAPGFGGINLEDISAPRCFEIEERLKEILDIPVFHDDQHLSLIHIFWLRRISASASCLCCCSMSYNLDFNSANAFALFWI